MIDRITIIYGGCLKVLAIKKTRKYDNDILSKTIEIKNGMNNKRTKFVWYHPKKVL